MSKKHKLEWSEKLRWSVRCSCSWGHLSSSEATAEEAVARHLDEVARIAAIVASRTTGQQTLEMAQ